MKYVICDIYDNKNIGNCSNYGASYFFNKIYIFDNECSNDEIEAFADSREICTMQCFRVACHKGTCIIDQQGNKHQLRPDYFYAEPVFKGGKHYMMGGAFAHTSNSVYSEITGLSQPIAIHDRTEDYED